MALTVVPVSGSVTTSGRNDSVGDGTRRTSFHRLVLDASYPTNGYPYDPKSFGFQGVVGAIFLSPRSVAATVTTRFEYDYVNKKVKAFVTSTGAEVANATNLSTVSIDAFVVGE